MGKKLLFIYNVHAGKSRIKTKLAEVIDVFIRAGYWVTAYSTQKSLDAQKVVSDYAHEYDLVVCSGGDGTLNETVTGMLAASCRVPIGYIPCGTTNDYAKSVGIPKGVLNAAQVAVAGNRFQTDIGMFNNMTFVYIAAFGIFTDVSYQTKQEMKNAIGHTAYILEGMKRLASVKSYHIKVRIDDTVLEDDFIYGMITNSISVGGFKNLTSKEVILDDGLFEAVFIRAPQNPLEFQDMLSAILLEGVESNLVCSFKAKRVQIKANDQIPWTLDGEYGGEHKDINIENHEQAIQIMVDSKLMLHSKKSTIPRIEKKS